MFVIYIPPENYYKAIITDKYGKIVTNIRCFSLKYNEIGIYLKQFIRTLDIGNN